MYSRHDGGGEDGSWVECSGRGIVGYDCMMVEYEGHALRGSLSSGKIWYCAIMTKQKRRDEKWIISCYKRFLRSLGDDQRFFLQTDWG